MDITEAELYWILGCLLLFGLVIGYPSLMTLLALMREQRVLGKLYWRFRAALDDRPRRQHGDRDL